MCSIYYSLFIRWDWEVKDKTTTVKVLYFVLCILMWCFRTTDGDTSLSKQEMEHVLNMLKNIKICDRRKLGDQAGGNIEYFKWHEAWDGGRDVILRLWGSNGFWDVKLLLKRCVFSSRRHKGTGCLWGNDWAGKVIPPLGSHCSISYDYIHWLNYGLWVVGNHWAKSATHLAYN